ncbi:Na+/H+ antiporter subunit C [Nitrincola tibetensis]|uniref:Na+/H+ antiporter subunit C n=1 Tax=Nitrincola tibetensis TaxID=2219697 RepID=A0A364NR52_9GAMM|nr:NADH-quinone oxidoreductase subunit K [Nitrincola tibetensis]RAU19524.1 Na+/H+ antiporter subunit C [Nitrincola tibetensis]
MSSYLIFAYGGVGLCGIGVFGFILHSHLLRRLIAFNLLGSGTFLILVGLSQSGRGQPDYIPQALVLTGIVVAVAATALALVLIRRWAALTKHATLPEDQGPS